MRRPSRPGSAPRTSLLLVLLAAACGGGPADTVRVAYEGAVPAPALDSLHLTLVEVTYAGGGSSAPHRHPCAVIGYVIEGALRSQVDGESLRVFRAGESFYEAPEGVHRVSANASAREPVRFLATFVCGGPGPRSVPVEAPRDVGTP